MILPSAKRFFKKLQRCRETQRERTKNQRFFSADLVALRLSISFYNNVLNAHWYKVFKK